MVLPLVLALVVIASTAPAPERPKVIVTGLSGSDAAMQRMADSLSDSLLTELARSKRVDAMGPGDLSTVLGLERQKQLLGCGTESASCLAEISAALGAPWVLTGSVLRMGTTTRIDLKLIHTSNGKVAWRDGRTLKDESEFFDAVAELVKTLVAQPEFNSAPERAPSGLVSTAAPGSAPSVAPWLVVGVGGAALVAGIVFSGLAGSEWGNLHSDPWRAATPWEGIRDETSAFNRNIVIGPVLLGAGAVAAGAGLIWALTSRQPPPAVTFWPTPNGVAVGGAF
ncbi:MAG: hypothetical protein Q8L48_29530 [Archangium sp.]|nr:hypothetical protein [Archangium sp.]